MKHKFLWFLLAVAGTASAAATAQGVVHSLQQDLAFDENDRLQQHHVLYTSGCGERAMSSWIANDLLNVREMSYELALSFVELPQSNCTAAFLTRGSERGLIQYVFPENTFSGSISGMQKWLQIMQRAEAGWINYNDNDCILYWIDANGGRVKSGVAGKGEMQSSWLATTLGHHFEAVDSVTGELMGKYTIEFESFFTIGHDDLYELRSNETREAEIEAHMESMFYQAQRVKRTFSELGFKKGKIPNDVYASMSAYIYNNRNKFTGEEQVTKTNFINHWQSKCLMIGIPWGLKGVWQRKLLKPVQTWVGDHTPLEPSVIYGIRRYTNGARLLQHVDRINTHAVSLILNVGQEGVREPWFVEIYDFAGRLHEIEMQPGEMIYYESARCLHGRVRPLNGTSYTNIFSHYRPVGDDEWYERPNPPDAPEPLLDVGECWLDREAGRPVCEKADLPTLSPALNTIYIPTDLFDWWEDVSRPETDPRKLALSGQPRPARPPGFDEL